MGSHSAATHAAGCRSPAVHTWRVRHEQLKRATATGLVLASSESFAVGTGGTGGPVPWSKNGTVQQ